MEAQHLHAKGSLFAEEEEEVGLQRRVSRLTKNVSKDVGEECDSSSSRSSRGNVGEFEEDPVPLQDVKDGVVNATNDEVKEEPKPKPEPEPEREEEAGTDEVLTKEENINRSAMEKTEVGYDGEEKSEEENVTSDFNSTVHFENEKGFESVQAHYETESNDVEKSVSGAELVYVLRIGEEISDAQKVHSSQILNQQKEIEEVENFTDSKLPSFKESHEAGSKHLDSGSGITEDVDIDVIEEVCPEETEFDVERVLEKQNTHDLFCPNCHSCITRRVILHRKKPKIPTLHHTEPTPVVETRNVHATTASITDAPTAPVADHNNNRDPEVFRCLSCFSFFIPTVNCFELRKIFGSKDEVPKVTDPQEIPADKDKKTKQETVQSPVEINKSLLDQNDSAPPTESSALLEQPIPIKSLASKGIADDANTKSNKTEEDTMYNLSANTVDVLRGKEAATTGQFNGTGETLAGIKPPSEDSSKKLYPIEVKIPPATEPIVVGRSLTDIDHGSVEKSKEFPDEIAQTKDSLLPDKSSTTEPPESMSNSSILPSKGLNEVKKVNQNTQKKLEDVVQTSKGEDVIVVIGSSQAGATVVRQQPENTTASEEAVTPQVVSQTEVDDSSNAQAQDSQDWDILKSIVYGGLVESITSLSIVSSAAGGGAKTLNTLALGLANLIGGLFVIAHNLRELKGSSESSVTSSGSTAQDRYFEQLGRRDNFCLHATVAIISFIIFGSVAPITYAFSFRESDSRDYKLAVVAAASLFCILTLAIGKAHVRTPPRSYFKTISYYVIMGLTASGVSFLVGELLDYLLQKFGWFDSSSTVTGALLEMGATGSGRASS